MLTSDPTTALLECPRITLQAGDTRPCFPETRAPRGNELGHGNDLLLGLGALFCLGVINLMTGENVGCRWLKSLFEKGSEQPSGRGHRAWAPPFKATSASEATGTPCPSGSLLPLTWWPAASRNGSAPQCRLRGGENRRSGVRSRGFKSCLGHLRSRRCGCPSLHLLLSARRVT